MDVKDLNLKVRLYILEGEDKFMGIGVLWLLKAMQNNCSLRSAAATLGISYSKAIKMIDNLEGALEMPVIDRRKGGSNRSGSSLTPFGLQFIKLYEKFQNTCSELVEKPFKDFTADLSGLKLEYKESK